MQYFAEIHLAGGLGISGQTGYEPPVLVCVDSHTQGPGSQGFETFPAGGNVDEVGQPSL